MREVGDILRSAGRDHAAARIEDRTLRLVDELREPRHLRRGRHGFRMVRTERHALGILRRGHPPLHVLRNVDDHGPGLAVRGDVKRLGDRLRHLIRTLHQEAVLRDGAADAVHVRLLEGVRADLVHRNLSRDADERHAVHVRGGETGDRVRRAGAARHEAHAGPSGRARIAVGHVDRPLLMPPQNKLERGFGEAVEDIQNRTARIAKQNFRARLCERIHERLRARSLFLLHRRLSLSFCMSQACAARSPRAAFERMRHSMAFLSSGFTPLPFS